MARSEDYSRRLKRSIFKVLALTAKLDYREMLRIEQQVIRSLRWSGHGECVALMRVLSRLCVSLSALAMGLLLADAGCSRPKAACRNHLKRSKRLLGYPESAHRRWRRLACKFPLDCSVRFSIATDLAVEVYGCSGINQKATLPRAMLWIYRVSYAPLLTPFSMQDKVAYQRSCVDIRLLLQAGLAVDGVLKNCPLGYWWHCLQIAARARRTTRISPQSTGCDGRHLFKP